MTEGRAAVAGRVVPILEIDAPVAKTKCVAYQHKIKTHSTSTPGAQFGMRDHALGQWNDLSSDVVGAFIVDDDSGRALVWPAASSMILEGPWRTREDRFPARGSYDGRAESEKILRSGETAYVMGIPRTYQTFLARLKIDCGEMPGELLDALLNRDDLKNIPCFFADGNAFIVSNRSFGQLKESLLPPVFEG